MVCIGLAFLLILVAFGFLLWTLAEDFASLSDVVSETADSVNAKLEDAQETVEDYLVPDAFEEPETKMTTTSDYLDGVFK